MKILVADDEEMIRYSIISMIGEMNFHIGKIIEAADGEEMIKASKKFQPELVFVDIKMPKINGLEAIRECKSFLTYTKFIIISSYEDFEFAREAIKLGVNEYLLKPVKPEELKTSIDKAIGEFKGNMLDDHFGLVERIKAYIENNFMKNIGIAQIASQFSITPNYLSHIFHKKSGIKFVRYMTDIRMKKSLEYLKIPGIKIHQVAGKVGFQNSKHFTKVFMKYYHCLPSEYQKNPK
jgi:two-component system, response regulator YesN